MTSNDEEKRRLVSSKVDLWLEWDQCSKTRDEIIDLRNNGKWNELESILVDRIQFGTAGLRAKMGPGFSQMNELTIIQTSQGLIRQVERSFRDQISKPLSLVIGFDGRHNSHRFARLVASLFVYEGFRVYLFDSKVVPTPFIPFSIIKKKAQVGVMITASHNPKEDNGYKVYWNNGAQIVSPIDSLIAQSIEDNLVPWENKAWKLENLDETFNSSWFDPIEEITNEYMSNLSRLSVFNSLNSSSSLKMVYTPVHGVGQFYAEKAFEHFNLNKFISVDEQKEPNGDFPTVKYPNPEEGKETLECSIKTAEANGADLIVANDPDADRFAVAEKDSNSGKWIVLSGNQLGTLLGWWRWFTWRNRNPNVDPKTVYMLYSTVSSKILQSMSKIEGFQTMETLTGFKWLGNKSKELIDDNKHVIFAFEEAIGFMCDPSNVLDKDGISALAIGAEMSVYLRSIGRTLVEQLDHLSTIYGFHLNNNSYLICRQTHLISKIFDRLRYAHDQDEIDPSKRQVIYPRRCGEHGIVRVRDLTIGKELIYQVNDQVQETSPSLPCSRSTEMISFYFDNGSELTIRASGTEPKLKWYSEIRREFPSTSSSTSIDDFRSSIRVELDHLVEHFIDTFLEPSKWNLLRK